jgi:NAD(P)-dependent dehydrogenase (short-subunit alcohol dehydrogenase family)
MDVVIVTGASKGLGAAFVDQLLSPDRRVIGIARSANDALAEAARAKGAWLDWYLQDLADVEASDVLAASICRSLPRDAARYVLINNAALMGPVGAVARLPVAETVAALNVNLASLMLFTARFLEATDALAVDRRVLNISSGSGRRPMDGNGVYSATKAGLDMFTRCLKAEQQERPTGRRARVVSLAPGVIDTDMQVYARSRDVDAFPQARYFAKMKDDGVLASPADAARKILGYLFRDDFGDVEIDDIRNV